jgi:hypothetical protein
VNLQPGRVPNYKRFLLTGAIIGLLVGGWFGMREPGGPSYNETVQYSMGTAVLFLGALGAFLGAGAAAILAIMLDRSGREK